MPNLVLLIIGVSSWTLAICEFRLGRILDRLEGETQISREDNVLAFWLVLGLHVLLGGILIALAAFPAIFDPAFDALP
jgi:hypothetical protein